jgi:predicted nuclease of predicted toxin-antitoxin system
MSSPPPVHKFLLDENVHRRLYRFLSEKTIDVILVPKGATDKQVATISRKEQRILVTNDEDFTEYTKEQIFSVIWLRIPQNEPQSLLMSFEKLIREISDFSERLFILKPKTWDSFPLGEQIYVKN